MSSYAQSIFIYGYRDLFSAVKVMNTEDDI